MKSFLRWAGSKKQLLSRLAPYYETVGGRYVEPFCGSASLFFRLTPESAWLNDNNSAVVNSLKCVRDEPEKLFDLWDSWGVGKEAYYDVRALDETKLGLIEQAARFIYLMRFCYGGVFRTNRAGFFNVPYGGGGTGSLPSKDELLLLSKELENVELTNDSYETVIAQLGVGDFAYLDPPYCDSKHDYAARTIPIEELNEALVQADKRGCKFVLSYSSIQDAKKAFQSNWAIEEVDVRRTIASSSAGRFIGSELLVTNVERS